MILGLLSQLAVPLVRFQALLVASWKFLLQWLEEIFYFCNTFDHLQSVQDKTWDQLSEGSVLSSRVALVDLVEDKLSHLYLVLVDLWLFYHTAVWFLLSEFDI